MVSQPDPQFISASIDKHCQLNLLFLQITQKLQLLLVYYQFVKGTLVEIKTISFMCHFRFTAVSQCFGKQTERALFLVEDMSYSRINGSDDF
jgi:hypothetical protein